MMDTLPAHLGSERESEVCECVCVCVCDHTCMSVCHTCWYVSRLVVYAKAL